MGIAVNVTGSSGLMPNRAIAAVAKVDQEVDRHVFDMMDDGHDVPRSKDLRAICRVLANKDRRGRNRSGQTLVVDLGDEHYRS
jgi:hypothetical protein